MVDRLEPSLGRGFYGKERANVANGLRRTNADKRRCVEVALNEFGDMSSRAIAELCGVSNHMVDRERPQQVGQNPTSTEKPTVIGKDGKTYPATQPPRTTPKAEKQTAIEEEEAEYLQKALAFSAARVYDFFVPELGTGIQPPTNTEEDKIALAFFVRGISVPG